VQTKNAKLFSKFGPFCVPFSFPEAEPCRFGGAAMLFNSGSTDGYDLDLRSAYKDMEKLVPVLNESFFRISGNKQPI
jgi:hypothetical protein